MLRLEFWAGQHELLASLAAAALTLVLSRQYTLTGGLGTLLSMLAFVVGGCGAMVAARSLARLDVDRALAGEINEVGAHYLSDVQGGLRAQIDLNEVERKLVPMNPASTTPGPIRMVQQVCKEARDRRFDSAANLVLAYRDEAADDLFRLQNLQKIALWLGILGTFLGLLVALQQEGATAEPGDAALLRLVRSMYGGLYTAFGASVAGLEVAILLGVVVLVLRRQQEAYFAALEDATLTVLSVARHSINRDEVLAELEVVGSAVGGLAARVWENTKALSARLDGVDTRLTEQNEQIDAGLERLAGARGEFERFLKEMSDAEHAFIADLAELFEAASFKDLARAIRAGAREAGEQLSARLDETATRNATQLEGFDASVQALTASVEAQARDFSTRVGALTTEVAAASAAGAEAIRLACDRMAAIVAARGDGPVNQVSIELLSSRIAELNRTISRFGPPRRSGVGTLLGRVFSGWWSRNGSAFPH
jgi:hypothetical protein